MNPDDRQEILDRLAETMNRRAKNITALNHVLKEFSTRLFEAIEHVLADAQAMDIAGIGKSRRIVHPAGAGREGLQVFIEDWSIIFVPMLGLARPNMADEARIPGAQFKDLCARIAVFLTDEPQGRAAYDFILFEDGSWFAWGYGWPKQQDDIESTDFEALASELVVSFVDDIFVTWHSRENTLLATALDAKKRAYTFGLPGEDIQGV